MSHKVFLLFTFFASFSAFSQEKLDNYVEVNAVTTDVQGNVYTTGSFKGNVKIGTVNLISAGGLDIFVAKYNPSGKCLWASRAGGAENDIAVSVAVDKAGNICIVGSITGKAAFGRIIIDAGDNSNFILAKFNFSGDPVWAQVHKGKGGRWAAAVACDDEGNIYATGYFDDVLNISNQEIKSSGNLDCFFLKASSSGKLAWLKRSGGAGEDRAVALAVHGSSIYFAGQEENSGNSNSFLAKFSSSGDVSWIYRPEPGGAANTARAVFADANSVVLAGSYYGDLKIENDLLNFAGGSDAYILKLNTSGKPLWSRSLSGRGYDAIYSLSGDREGNVLIAGSYTISLESEGVGFLGFGAEDGFAMKINPTGKITWWHAFGNKHNDVATGIASDAKGNFYYVGNYISTAKFGEKTLTSKAGRAALFVKMNESSKLEFAINGAEPDPDFDPVAAKYYVNLYAKLLTGKSVKESLVNQVVKLLNENDEVLQITQTDLYGDFSFKNVDSREKVRLVIPPGENLSGDASLFLANQNGIILRELTKDKNNSFSYQLLPADVNTLAFVEEDDTQLKIKNFKKSDNNELLVKENIIYESGKSELDSESKQTLNKIAITLKQNPNYHIEIYAHTDAIGEANDNLVLSEKRAQVVKQYIVSRGVPQEKITAKGLGETQILNRCFDGVSCSETEHQYNRRTEFKLVKK
jgi:outer membrane protein OmpA-like peptidoglycan-associated protein